MERIAATASPSSSLSLPRISLFSSEKSIALSASRIDSEPEASRTADVFSEIFPLMNFISFSLSAFCALRKKTCKIKTNKNVIFFKTIPHLKIGHLEKLVFFVFFEVPNMKKNQLYLNSMVSSSSIICSPPDFWFCWKFSMTGFDRFSESD